MGYVNHSSTHRNYGKITKLSIGSRDKIFRQWNQRFKLSIVCYDDKWVFTVESSSPVYLDNQWLKFAKTSYRWGKYYWQIWTIKNTLSDHFWNSTVQLWTTDKPYWPWKWLIWFPCAMFMLSHFPLFWFFFTPYLLLGVVHSQPRPGDPAKQVPSKQWCWVHLDRSSL